MSWEIRQGDALALLRVIPDATVQTCVTSPPYWGLRDYGTATWTGGDAACDHKKPLADVGHIAHSTLGGGKATNAAQIGGYRQACGRCGAVRIDAQLGLEPTPEAYVAGMVALFREVSRVLRDNGTLWLNLGDSYAAGCMTGKHGANSSISNPNKGHVATRIPPRSAPPGLKPKDLVGIPWRVAFALQQPYYTGTIRDERDRIWLAAMIDAEGCIFIHKRKIGQDNGQGYERKSDSYGSGLEVANTSTAIVERVLAITGRGSICSQTPEQSPGRKQTILRWNLRSNECRDVLREVYPYLVGKQQQARLAIGCPSSGPKAEAAHAALIGLHRGHATDVDFTAPASMFEPGYYLRSDIIWNKANPMPESVTDRPTKAHEYLFLLAKSERYFYDAGAVMEPLAGNHDPNHPLTVYDNTPPPPPGQSPHTGLRRYSSGNKARTYGGAVGDRMDDHMGRNVPWVDKDGRRNRRSVWTIVTEPFAEAHFAVMPQALVEPCILAGSRPGDLVLDPFAGSGTVGVVALRHGRRFLGLELNATYAAMARRRIAGPLFAETSGA